jgi:hypothetical protein
MIEKNNRLANNQHIENPLISVIIPNYNLAQYIGEAIQSVLHQTYQNFEIIVVDDGSTDNSREVIAGYQDRVKYIWQQNRGLSAARNTGLRNATGDLVAFLDADDLWYPEFFSSLIPLLDQPQIGAVYCGSQFIDDAGNLLPQTQTLTPSPKEFRSYLLDGNFIPVHAVLIRRECLQKICVFDESLTALEDYDLWLCLSRRWLFVGCAEILALIRVRPSSMSSDIDRMATQEQAVIRKHYPPNAVHTPHEKEEMSQLLGNAYLRTSIAALTGDQWDKAARYLIDAFTTCPELIGRLDSYYGLLMAELPRGKKHFTELTDLNNARDRAEKLIGNAFSRMEGFHNREQRISLANLHVASGQLAYARRDLSQARLYFLQALITDFRVLCTGQNLGSFFKSFLKPGLLDQLRKLNRYRK